MHPARVVVCNTLKMFIVAFGNHSVMVYLDEFRTFASNEPGLFEY